MNNNNLKRKRSGRKDNTQKSTPSSIIPSIKDKNKKLNINLNEKKFQDILKTSKFNFDPKIDNNTNNNNIGSINDIKKECFATMRVSEKVQSKILNEGNKIINTLEEKYFLLDNKSTSLSLSLQENINNINLGFFSKNFINIEENKEIANNNFTEEE